MCPILALAFAPVGAGRESLSGKVFPGPVTVNGSSVQNVKLLVKKTPATGIPAAAPGRHPLSSPADQPEA